MLTKPLKYCIIFEGYAFGLMGFIFMRLHVTFKVNTILLLALLLFSANIAFSVGATELKVAPLFPMDYPEIFPENGFLYEIYNVHSAAGEYPENAVLTLPLGNVDSEQYGRGNLRIAYFSEESNEWKMLDSAVDGEYNTISAEAKSPGIYTITAITIEDAISPTIEWKWNTPEENSTVNAVATIEVNAKDNVGVAGVRFFLDDVHVYTDLSSIKGGWYFELDFSKISAGKHVIKAAAYDRAGNSAEVTRNLMVESDVIPIMIAINSLIYVNSTSFSIGGAIQFDESSETPSVDIFINNEYLGNIKVNDGKWGIYIQSFQYDVSPLTNGSIITVRAKDNNGNNASDSIILTIPFDEVSLYVDKRLILVNEEVELSAFSAGGTDVEYEFSASSDDGNTWNVIREFTDEDACFHFFTVPGDYLLKVVAREKGKIAEKYAFNSMTVNSALSGVLLFSDIPSPQQTGQTITFKAEPIGGASDTHFEYQYQVDSGDGFVTIQEYNHSPYLYWGSKLPDNYTIKVNMREIDDNITVYSDSCTYAIIAGTPTPTLQSVELVSSVSSPVQINREIILTASTVGGENIVYKFTLFDGENTYILKDFYDYGDNEITWQPTDLGVFTLRVEAMDEDELVIVKDETVINIVVEQPLDGVTLSADLVSPQELPTRIILTAATKTGYNVYYRFDVDDGTGFKTIRRYSGQDYYIWYPTQSGMYALKVTACEGDDLEDDNATTYSEQIAFVINDTKNSILDISLTANKEMPQNINTSISLTTTVIGGINLEYKYMISRDNGSSWEELRDFDLDSNYNWRPNSSGNYVIKSVVRAKNDIKEYGAYLFYPIGIEMVN